MEIINSFNNWKEYSKTHFLKAIENHDICAPQLVISLDYNDMPTCYLIQILEWGSWLVINGFEDLDYDQLVDVFEDRTLYRMKKIPAGLQVVLPSIIRGERKMINVQIWRESGLLCIPRLPPDFLEMYQELPLLQKYSTADFNLFVELALNGKSTQQPMYVQEWFVFARTGGSLVAVNTNPTSRDWGNLIYIIEGLRQFENKSICYCSINLFLNAFYKSENRLDIALAIVDLYELDLKGV